MSRPLRIQFPQAVYHVMNRGRATQPTFIDDGDYQAFLDTLGEAHRLWCIEVFAYSLMGNHYHLCLRAPKGNLSRVMRHVDGLYTQRFNRRHRRDGTLFRGRYKAILVDADEYLAAVAYSDPNRPPIPRQIGHLFRSNPATVPEQIGQPVGGLK